MTASSHPGDASSASLEAPASMQPDGGTPLNGTAPDKLPPLLNILKRGDRADTTRPLRVLEVIEATAGGTKRHLLDLLAGFQGRDDLQVEVACPDVREGHGGDTSFVSDVRALGVPVHLVAMRRAIDPRRDVSAMLHLTPLLLRGRYDIVHLHSSKAGAIGRAAVWLARARRPGRRPKIIYTPNGWSFLIPGRRSATALYTAVEWLLGKVTDRLIVVSEDERREALNRGIIPAEKSRLVRSGIEPQRLPGERLGDEKRQELGWGPRGETVVVGTVARLTVQKDPTTWLLTAARVLAHRPDVRFVWIGHGEMEPEFLALMRRLGLGNGPQFQYLGYRSDARELIAALDIVSLSSVFEAGLPYVLMEAMAMDRPVVVTAGSGSRELIRDGVEGFLVPLGDSEALADRILRLVDDPALRVRLGRAGRDVVLESCTTERQVRDTAQVYYDALGLPDPYAAPIFRDHTARPSALTAPA